MADYKVTDTELTSIAKAIRAKTGSESSLSFPTGFVSEIGNTLKLSYMNSYNTGLSAAEDQSEDLDLQMLTGDEKIIIGVSANGTKTGQGAIFGFYCNTAAGDGLYTYDTGVGMPLSTISSLTWDDQNLQMSASGGGVFEGTYYIIAFT